MNHKNAITMTALSTIAVFAIASLGGFQVSNTDAETVAVQPEKFVFVEKVTPTAEFKFRDGVETTAFQIFSQTTGSIDKTGRTNTFTLEKIAGGTPHLYQAADEAIKYVQTVGMDYQYENFDVDVLLAVGGDVVRSFAYTDCKVVSYSVTTRTDNEEGYTGKGFAVVDQFSFECNGYKPDNPAMDELNHVEKAKTVSSNDLKSTDKWEPGFSKK